MDMIDFRLQLRYNIVSNLTEMFEELLTFHLNKVIFKMTYNVWLSFCKCGNESSNRIDEKIVFTFLAL